MITKLSLMLLFLLLNSCNQKLSEHKALAIFNDSVPLPQKWQLRKIDINSFNPLIKQNTFIEYKLSDDRFTYLFTRSENYAKNYQPGDYSATVKSHFPLSYSINSISQEQDDNKAEVELKVEYGVSPFFIDETISIIKLLYIIAG